MKKLLIILTLSIITYASNLPTNSIVKVYASLSIPDYKQPWQTPSRIQVTGSGVVIQDDYIITNAHVISNSKFTQVSKGNDSKKYTASIEYVSHQADLALLKVKDKEFYKDVNALKFTEEVKTGDNITVLGYPLGGNNLSTTKGVVSRLEIYSYVHSYENMFGIQIDAAINSGNSGGAALDDNNNVVGIVMQKLTDNNTDNIGYIIPSVVVKTFLEDIKDKKVDGFDNSNTYFDTFLSPTKKEYYKINDNQGVIVSQIEKDETAIKLGDIVLEVEGNKIFNDGKVETKYGLQQIRYFEHLKPVGETIVYKVRRDNKILDAIYTLKKKNEVVYYEYDKEPRYLIYGGLVFAPLTQNYLFANKLYNIKLFENFYQLKDKAKNAIEGVVLQQEKFDHSVNEGYIPGILLVHSVNNIKVKDFNHFVKLIDEVNDKYTVIDFIDLDYSKIILDTKKAKESFEEIKNVYGLSSDRRVVKKERIYQWEIYLW